MRNTNDESAYLWSVVSSKIFRTHEREHKDAHGDNNAHPCKRQTPKRHVIHRTADRDKNSEHEWGDEPAERDVGAETITEKPHDREEYGKARGRDEGEGNHETRRHGRVIVKSSIAVAHRISGNFPLACALT